MAGSSNFTLSILNSGPFSSCVNLPVNSISFSRHNRPPCLPRSARIFAPLACSMIQIWPASKRVICPLIMIVGFSFAAANALLHTAQLISAAAAIFFIFIVFAPFLTDWSSLTSTCRFCLLLPIPDREQRGISTGYAACCSSFVFTKPVRSCTFPCQYYRRSLMIRTRWIDGVPSLCLVSVSTRIRSSSGANSSNARCVSCAPFIIARYRIAATS